MHAADEYCCESHAAGHDHDGDCENYDGAPLERWQVTTPPEVYLTD